MAPQRSTFKRVVPPIVGLVGFAWLRHKLRPTRRESTEELEEHRGAAEEMRAEDRTTALALKTEIDRIVGELIAEGRAVISEGVSDDESHVWFSLEPASPGAAKVTVWPDSGEVGMSVGHGSLELWRTDDQDPVSTFADLLLAVIEGRYAEYIKKGLIFARKVEMQFIGTEFGKYRYADLTETGEGIPLGPIGYDPW